MDFVGSRDWRSDWIDRIVFVATMIGCFKAGPFSVSESIGISPIEISNFGIVVSKGASTDCPMALPLPMTNRVLIRPSVKMDFSRVVCWIIMSLCVDCIAARRQRVQARDSASLISVAKSKPKRLEYDLPGFYGRKTIGCQCTVNCIDVKKTTRCRDFEARGWALVAGLATRVATYRHFSKQDPLRDDRLFCLSGFVAARRSHLSACHSSTSYKPTSRSFERHLFQRRDGTVLSCRLVLNRGRVLNRRCLLNDFLSQTAIVLGAVRIVRILKD